MARLRISIAKILKRPSECVRWTNKSVTWGFQHFSPLNHIETSVQTTSGENLGVHKGGLEARENRCR